MKLQFNIVSILCIFNLNIALLIAHRNSFHFSGAEAIFAAEQQLEAAQGIEDTPFVTMKLTIDETNQIMVEAFQVSKQCMEMVAEGVLAPSKNLGHCSVNPTFTAIVEGREAKEVKIQIIFGSIVCYSEFLIVLKLGGY